MKWMLSLSIICSSLTCFAETPNCQNLFQLEIKYNPLITSEDRQIRQNSIGKRIYVFNEITKKIWTAWARDSDGKLKKLFWAESLSLKNAEFEIDEAKRQLVIKRGKRMPHAGVWGILQAEDALPLKSSVGIRYNPFENPEEPAVFRAVDTGEKIESADTVNFKSDGQVFGDIQ
jgi:hypothetical protein